MIDLGAFVRANLVRPRVVHGIPGRLRLSVPGLKGLPPSALELLDGLDLSEGGVFSIEASLYTGNALIRYDAERLRQEEILKAVSALALTFLRYRERLLRIPEGRLPEAARKFQEHLTATPALFDGKELNLPDDLWQ